MPGKLVKARFSHSWHCLRPPKYPIHDRLARQRLRVRGKPYFLPLAHGRSLGYRRGKVAGSWWVRFCIGGERYRYKSLGMADDTEPADGIEVLSFEQARRAALRWFDRHAAEGVNPIPHKFRDLDLPVLPPAPPYTVAHAGVDYLRWCMLNHATSRNKFYSFRCYILPHLGHIPLEELSGADVYDWFIRIADMPARIRTAEGTRQRHRGPPKTPEELRKRRRTANVLLYRLKAILNFAFTRGMVSSDNAWARIRSFRGVDRARVVYLTMDECRDLLDACDDDIRQLVAGGLLTGCRFGELQRVQVQDFVPQTGKLFIFQTKMGTSRVVSLTERGRQAFLGFTKDKEPEDHIFWRRDDTPWGAREYAFRLGSAVKRAGIRKAVSFYTLRHTYASHAAMEGVDLFALSKQLGHRDPTRVGTNYAHFTESYVDREIRRKMIDLA